MRTFHSKFKSRQICLHQSTKREGTSSPEIRAAHKGASHLGVDMLFIFFLLIFGFQHFCSD